MFLGRYESCPPRAAVSGAKKSSFRDMTSNGILDGAGRILEGLVQG